MKYIQSERGPKEDVPSALARPDQSAFAPPLVALDAIVSGGPPPDGIPAIDAPEWEPAGEVDWLRDAEPVVVVEIAGESRAYPVQILVWHELVNDTVAGTPITVSFCPLCNSAIVFDRTVGERVLDFGTSGRLYQSAMVMYDRQTESLWSQFVGEAIVGHLVGTRLRVRPSAMVSWQTFREQHRHGQVLSRNTGFGRDYGRNPYPGYDEVGTTPFLFRGPIDATLPAMARVVGLRTEDDAVAIPLDALAAGGVAEVTVGETSVVVFHQAGMGSALDAATIDGGRDIGQTRAFALAAPGGFRRTEQGFEDQLGTTWDFRGRAIAGPRSGESLPAFAHLDTFWFAWSAFQPRTRIAGT